MKLLSGPGTRKTETPSGQFLRFQPELRGWRHPWMTDAKWDGVSQQWTATVKEATVGGHCPVVQTTIPVGKKKQRDFGINPLTGLPYFSSFIFNRNRPAPATVEVDIPLYARPIIPLSFRNIGADGLGDTVPNFFLNRGVQPPPKIDASGDVQDAISSLLNFQPKPGNRLLRACDLVLHQPRQALTSTITLEPGLVTGLSNYTQTISIRSAAPGDRLKVFATSKWIDIAGTAGIDPLAGDYEEPTFDERLISTVYLLSPPNLPLNSVPDGRWQPFVKHSDGFFWNLEYATPSFKLLPTDPPKAFYVPLAAGAAQIAINVLTAGINDMAQQALNILSAHSLQGSFWTATGGGTDGTFPIPLEPKAAGKTGLDKDGRNAARRRAKAQALRNERLDPPFPFRGLPFPLELLT